MMSAPVDLHIHSNRSSDGSLSPSKIVALAFEKKMQAISIADHDTVAAYPEALRCEHAHDVEVIPSVELTTCLGNREFHLLLPFIDWNSKTVADLIRQVADRRIREARHRVAKLQELGMELSWNDVQQESGSFPPLGVTIAAAFLKKAEIQQDPRYRKYYDGKTTALNPYRFYRDYFTDGQPAFVPRRSMNVLDVLKMSRQIGSVPVLAHPGASFMNVNRTDITPLKETGLEGLEVFTSYHDKKQTEFYQELAEEFGLVATGGSDFHGTIKPHVPFGFLEQGDYGMVEELKKRRP